MTIARVADEMDFEADERLLRENVNRNPPLHIRRTIDQYYFPTLEDTSVRDKDQVVYRGTRAGRSFHTKNTRVVMVDQLWLWILDDRECLYFAFSYRWNLLTRGHWQIPSSPHFLDGGAEINPIRLVFTRVFASGSNPCREASNPFIISVSPDCSMSSIAS